ncbi:MAG: AAA family ATPase [Actinomycetia bacterium]|nr:AAA family ATPase [Actinomycetes bacterium]
MIGHEMDQDLHILTGAPGTGKTAVLGHLTTPIRRIDEPAREVLAEHRAAGEQDAQETSTERFVELILQRSIAKYETALEWGEPVMFDRGIPDCIAYALHLGVDPQPAVEASMAHRYNEHVLILEPWEEIYTTDEERNMTFNQVLSFHESVQEAYQIAGYTLDVVPRARIEERASFVDRSIKRA